MVRTLRFHKNWVLPLAVLGLAAGFALRADEGMWLFSSFPSDRIGQKYGFSVQPSFLKHMQLSAVRFNNGGTGSFVSKDGLLFTNHHVGADCIQKLSGPNNDLMGKGFYAARQADEKPCPDLEVNTLLSTEDVTARVTAKVTRQTEAAEANRIRKAAMSEIEKECVSKTGNRCEVVTLFSGGQFHLYQYKKYTDVRLVFAPEFGIAFFGGDPDNFTYPRYALDIAFFRAYENGKPAQVSNFFRWSKQGVQDKELVFVPGNPGTTGRLATVAELEFYGELSYPLIIRRLESLVAALEAYGKGDAEKRRAAQENLFSQQNSLKAYRGFLRGLKDAQLMKAKRESERDFRERLSKDPALNSKFAVLYDNVANAWAELKGYYDSYWLLERAATRGSTLLEIARDIVRYSTETKKPNSERLREYTESALPSLEQTMYSTAPLDPGMEIAVLADYFAFLKQTLGAKEETVERILQGRTPEQAARAYVSSSKLTSVEERKRLAASAEAVKASEDGMIKLALLLEPRARQLRRLYEDRVEAVTNPAAAEIAQARLKLLGATSEYPDATFTLRLAYGQVRGYENDQGKPVPYATRIGGLFERGAGKDPYIVPESWLKAKEKLNPNIPFDFVSTADTHGGNSGSATVNTRGEIVGILFDGNIEGLPNRFFYSETQARSVHVASQAIVEALDKVYRADRLLGEIGMAKR